MQALPAEACVLVRTDWQEALNRQPIWKFMAASSLGASPAFTPVL